MIFTITNAIINVFFNLESKLKVDIDWLSDWTQFIMKRISNRDPVHLEQ